MIENAGLQPIPRSEEVKQKNSLLNKYMNEIEKNDYRVNGYTDLEITGYRTNTSRCYCYCQFTNEKDEIANGVDGSNTQCILYQNLEGSTSALTEAVVVDSCRWNSIS
jgi:hypothetical protein